MERKVTVPMTEEAAAQLHAGDYVLLSGTVYTARDAAHQRLHEMIAAGQPLPFDLSHAVIYYVGPTPAKPGQVIGAAGPTTSARMDVYTPELLARGLGGMIGKGRRSAAVKESIAAHRAVYFIAAGGAAALYSHCICKAEPVAFADLLSEAIVRLEIKDFPCFVGIDAQGKDIYDLG